VVLGDFGVSEFENAVGIWFLEKNAVGICVFWSKLNVLDQKCVSLEKKRIGICVFCFFCLARFGSKRIGIGIIN